MSFSTRYRRTGDVSERTGVFGAFAAWIDR